jgi:Tfp pilus assembly protein FimV
VVTVLVVAVFSTAVLLLTALVSGRAQATNHGEPRAGYQGMHEIVVRPGQTLWSIAAAAEPAADPRSVVQEIMAANALAGPGITAGQLLWIP